MSFILENGVSIECVDGQSIMITAVGDAAVLNETADYMLKELLKGVEKDAIVNMIVTKYEIDVDTVLKDLDNLVHELMNKKLICIAI